ncbi:hypothetical protein ACCW94_10220 [Enterobacter soli]
MKQGYHLGVLTPIGNTFKNKQLKSDDAASVLDNVRRSHLPRVIS